MYNIKKLNPISKVVYDYLKKENYTVSSHIEEEDVDAYLVRSANCHEMDFSDRVLAIARAGAGVNNIPIDKCTEKGIVVFNTPGANANGVKELVLCGMLIASRNVLDAAAWCKTLKGKGDEVTKLVEKGKGQFVGPELKGKTIGVIGLGAIGVMVANTAAAIGMNVIGYDPFVSVDAAWHLSRATTRAMTLDELLKESDYITIHIPLNDKTKHFISSPEFSKMKSGVILLNFARNGIVKNTSLFEAIESGIVAKYVTDFPEDEIIDHPNVIAIPHLGASTPESEENCAMMAADQIRDYIETGSIVNSINLPEVVVAPTNDMRICVIHKNLPNMVSSISSVIASANHNIAEMTNKSKKDVAYTVLTMDAPVEDSTVQMISEIDGVIKVRLINPAK